jgi:hypothetical protein
MIPITKNVTVFAPDGERLNNTYPKRAQGLVKKGRAIVTAPDAITMTLRPPGTEKMMKNILEKSAGAADITGAANGADDMAAGAVVTGADNMATGAADTGAGADDMAEDMAAGAADMVPDARELVNRYRGLILEFNTREWKPNPDLKKNNITERVFYSDEIGELLELWQLGDWGWNWSEIVTSDIRLDTYTDYRVIFWLKTDKNNDNRKPIHRFEITFDGDYENRNIYSLSDGFVKPLLIKDGWKLFCIPFSTGGFERVSFRFVAQHAPMSVKQAVFDELSGVFPEKAQENFNKNFGKNFDNGNPPKLDFSGVMGMDFDSDDVLEQIFGYLNNPAISFEEKVSMMGMIQSIF